MARIPLSAGRSTIVDDEDLPVIDQWKWSFNGYAYRSDRGRTVYLHRLLVGAPAGMEVDHINGDHLDNRRANLRVVTRAQNQQNLRTVRRDNKTGVRGVMINHRTPGRPFLAEVRRDRKRLYSQSFATLEEAAEAVKEARRRLMPYSVEEA